MEVEWVLCHDIILIALADPRFNRDSGTFTFLYFSKLSGKSRAVTGHCLKWDWVVGYRMSQITGRSRLQGVPDNRATR